MTPWGILVIGALGLLIIYMVGKALYEIVYALLNYFIPERLHGSLLIKKLKPKYKAPLEKHLSYYQKLPLDKKKVFEKRVQKFIDLKDFIPREMREVTDEMKSLISGSAIQLTFGLPGVYFSHFSRILVYPDAYYSKIRDDYHQGEVNLKGIIVISWKNFAKGYIDRRDGRNLGLHEMAHALRLENAITNNEYNFLDPELLKIWHQMSHEEISRMLEGGDHFFREYAAANQQEFFAVAVENFFERPREFNQQKPELYDVLARLLNQNPLALFGVEQ